MKKSCKVTAGKGGAKPITGYNAKALDRGMGDAGTAKACASKTRSPYNSSGSKSNHYYGPDCSGWGGKVSR